MLPFSLVDNKHFWDFVHLLDPRYEVPSCKTLTAALQKKMTAVKKKMKADLGKCRDIAITHDGWTSIKTESYNHRPLYQ